MKTLLSAVFKDVDVIQVAPFDIQLARDLLPRWTFLLFRAAMKLHLLRPRFHFRLIANARNPKVNSGSSRNSGERI